MNQKVAIIFGGPSAEHEISLRSATNIYNAIDGDQFSKVLIGIDRDHKWHYRQEPNAPNNGYILEDFFNDSIEIILGLEGHILDKTSGKTIDSFDIAFPIIHGSFGEDGILQGVLQSLKIPYVGPDVLGSSVCMDKDMTKRLLRDQGIPIADFITVHHYSPEEVTFDMASEKLGLPLFIKPANAGSSVGVSKVTKADEFHVAIENALQYDHKVLIEEAVVGKEVECAILGNEAPKASVIGEIVPTVDFYSYEAKYIDANGAKLRIPAEIDHEIAEKIKETAIQAFRTTGCEGLARVDFFLRPNNEFVLNEINTLPGFTSISMYPKLWEASGLPYGALISELIQLALKRSERNKSLKKDH